MNDQAYLESILRGIILHRDELRIKRTEDARGVLFRVNVAKPDMPVLIGKAGQCIAAIRLLMKIYAKAGPSISIILEEPPHDVAYELEHLLH